MLEEEKETQAMEAVDEDDGTFTNISLTDDTGKASRNCSAVLILWSFSSI